MQKEDMILELLKKQSSDLKNFRSEMLMRFDSVDKRFEAQDKRFEAQDKRFEDFKESVNQRFEALEDSIDERFDVQEERMADLKYEIRRIGQDVADRNKKLDEVYDTRHEVEYKITRDFIVKNLGWNAAVIVAGVLVLDAVLR